jgi:predicted ATPase
MLKRLRVQGLWSLASVDLTLRRTNVILGANGSGKSGLLNTFRLLRAIVSRGLAGFVQDMGGAASVLHYGPKHTRHGSIELEFDGPKGTNGYEASLTYVAGDRLVFADERVWFQRDPDRPRSEHSIGPGAHTESHLGFAIDEGSVASPIAKVVKWQLDRFCHHHFHDTSMTAALRRGCDQADTAFLRSDGANLAAFLRAMRAASPEAYRRVRDAVQRVFPQFDDFVLEPSNGSVMLRWRETGNAYDFGPHHLSDGTLRFIAFATLLLQSGDAESAAHPNFPRMIVVDEPELGLHPSALTLVGEMLHAFSAQSVIATQSVDMVGHLVTDETELDRIVLAERSGAGSSFRRADPAALRPWLEDYAPNQLWTHGLLGALA